MSLLAAVCKLERGSSIWTSSPSTALSESKGERKKEKNGKEGKIKEAEREREYEMTMCLGHVRTRGLIQVL